MESLATLAALELLLVCNASMLDEIGPPVEDFVAVVAFCGGLFTFLLWLMGVRVLVQMTTQLALLSKGLEANFTGVGSGVFVVQFKVLLHVVGGRVA